LHIIPYRSMSSDTHVAELMDVCQMRLWPAFLYDNNLSVIIQ